MNARVFGVELVDELRAILREPTALFFSIIMPVGFFAFFTAIFGDQIEGGMAYGTTMLAMFGTFGVLSVTLVNAGVGVASDRETGWLRTKQISASPVRVILAAKVTAALQYAVGVLVAMAATAALLGVLEATPLQLLCLGAVLVLGSLPFALVGLAIGFQTSTNTAVAILNALLMPSAILSGLWMPLSILPEFLQQLAPYLPPYHLSQIALAQITGDGVLDHVLALIGMTVLASALAGWSLKNARV
jgi:ABC-2 type transport system permease protein